MTRRVWRAALDPTEWHLHGEEHLQEEGHSHEEEDLQGEGHLQGLQRQAWAVIIVLQRNINEAGIGVDAYFGQPYEGYSKKVH